MLKAIAHAVSPEINHCELTHLARQPIDYAMAVQQHDAYCTLLRDLGADVTVLTRNESYPDSVFIEDNAVIFDEVAVMASMGAASRRQEVAAVEEELENHRPVAHIRPAATLEGGDVVRLGSTVFVGQTCRTNRAGISALEHILQRHGYHVVPVAVQDCLHLKSACTAIGERSVLVNPNWLDLSPFSDFNVLAIDEAEPWAANTINVNGAICMHAGFRRTAGMLRELGFEVATVDISEFLKAEAGMSCLSLRFGSAESIS